MTMKKKLLIGFVVSVLLAACVGLWVKSKLSYSPWELAPQKSGQHVLFEPDLNLQKDAIYTDEENRVIMTKVSPAKHLLDTRLGAEAILGLLAFSNQVDVGQMAPDFSLPLAAGGVVTLSELRGKTVVFMFVAMTCPPARHQVPRFEELAKQYDPEKVAFFGIYSRERHSGEKGYPHIQFAETEEQKVANANMLASMTDLPLAIDTFDEKVLNLYGRVPNSAYVINPDGVIVFRSTWADDTKVKSIIDYLDTQ